MEINEIEERMADAYRQGFRAGFTSQDIALKATDIEDRWNGSVAKAELDAVKS